MVYNYLILLRGKFEKMPKLGFFDSLAMYLESKISVEDL